MFEVFPSRLRTVALGSIAFSAIAATGVPAFADESSTTPFRLFEKSYTISSTEFEAARTVARKAENGLAKARISASERDGEITEYLNESKKSGGVSYTASDVEVIDLSKDLRVTLPRKAKVNSITVNKEVSDSRSDANGQEMKLLKASVSVDSEPVHQGDGMTMATTADDPYPGFTIDHNVNLKITLKGIGEMLAIANGGKLNQNDSRNYYVYEHKGLGQPIEVSGLNWSVTGMILKNFLGGTPTPEMVENHQWVGFDPGGEFTANCGDDYQLGVDVKGVIFSGYFKACDSYKPNIAIDWPGSMELTHSQGKVFNPGNRELAYATSHSVPASETQLRPTLGKAVLQMARWTYPAEECTILGDENNEQECDT